jgi:3-deoxy-7-phosphoheptulonate synthase
MIDCSHANSQKEHRRQIDVARNVATQLMGGEARVIGVMVESHLQEGRQEIRARDRMTYGQSVTDACIGWDDTVGVLRELARAVAHRRERLAKTA